MSFKWVHNEEDRCEDIVEASLLTDEDPIPHSRQRKAEATGFEVMWITPMDIKLLHSPNLVQN